MRGYKAYGIYPLLDDNTSYLLAVDFDGDKWQTDSVKFIKQCIKHKLPAYLEKSRSGQGAHVWLFFENNYPAYKSRNIIVNILKEAEIIDQFEKDDSFDRLIPNQDSLSGQGFGNLIALPLQGELRKLENTVFLDSNNDLQPYPDQWQVLQNIQKIAVEHLDEIYAKFNSNYTTDKNTASKKINIAIKNSLLIKKDNLPKKLVNFLKDNLNFLNTEALIKKKVGFSVYGTEKYFKLIETEADHISIPRGFLPHLINFLDENGLAYKISDETIVLPEIKYQKPNFQLFPYQQIAIDDLLMSENGILVSPAGSGKTIMGIELIHRLKQPALILVHKKQIFNQWVERIESFLGIPKKEIGQICSSKNKIGEKITVAMVQTLCRQDNLEIANKFGLIIVDECHHMPAKMFRKAITSFNPHYLYGFTATPTRKHNDEKLIFIYLGDILYTIENSNLQSENNNTKNKIIIRETSLAVPFTVKTTNFQLLAKILTFDSNRNNLIINDVAKEADNHKRCLILTERKDHAEILCAYLKSKYEIIVLTGDLTEKQRREKIKQIQTGHFQILIATGQLIGEGTDFTNLDCLFLVYPFSYSGKLIQYIGRLERGDKNEKIIYDYRDIKISYLEKFFKQRFKHYKKNYGL